MKTNNTEPTISKYPYAPLALCLPVAFAVNDLGGNNSRVQKSLLASHLKEDEKSQGLNFKIASAKCYGLIDGRSDFSLTQTAREYFYPTRDGQKRNALLHFLSNPPAFRLLIQRFDGSRLPQIETLGNILHTEAAVPISWKDRVAGFFVRSAQYVEVVDQNDFLRIRASRASLDGKIAKNPVAAENSGMDDLSETTNNAATPKGQEGRAGVNVWTHTIDGKTIRLESPSPLPSDLWQVLEGFVKLIKPKKT